jgi:hypothetical protein
VRVSDAVWSNTSPGRSIHDSAARIPTDEVARGPAPAGPRGHDRRIRIASSEELAPFAPAVHAQQSRSSGRYDRKLLADPVAGPSLMAYLILTDQPEVARSLGLQAEEVFASRYYWLRRFIVLREANVGPNAGLHQQAMQLLEHPEPKCTPDWALLEAVEDAAEQDAAAILDGRDAG